MSCFWVDRWIEWALLAGWEPSRVAWVVSWVLPAIALAVVGPPVAARILYRAGRRWLAVRLLAAWTLAVVTACGLWAMEWGTRVVQARGLRLSVAYDPPEPYVTHDPDLGYRPRAGRRTISRFVDGRPLFRSVRTVDAQGRRDPPGRGDGAVVGCSVAMGHCVQDQETLGALLDADNWACDGYGPVHILQQARLGRVRARRWVLYPWIDDHVQRATASCDWTSRWIPRGALVARRVGSQIQVAGPVCDVRPWTSAVAYLFGGSALFGEIRRFAPLLTTGSDFDLAADVVAAAGREFGRRGARFVVFVWPGSRTAAIVPRLQARGVDVVDGSSWPSTEVVAHDGHPTAAAYRAVADRLRGYLVPR